MKKSNAHYWLALKLVPRLAVYKKLALVDSYGLTALFCSSKTSKSTLTSANNLTSNQLAAFHHPDWEKIDNILLKSGLCQSVVVSYGDEEYPKKLKQIFDPPLVLFVQGNINLLNKPQLAVVGSRFASVDGRETAFELSKEVAEQHIVITSGLALGVDGCAHKGALTTDTGTIAVVATGLDQVYPARHRSLAKDILSHNGAIVSEFLPGVSPKAGHFPKRNRIISGLSLGVLVVEAAIKSGSLITARCAVEHNREVFAVPSTLKNPLSKGCHWLIKQGAKLVENSADIIEDLALDKPATLMTREKTPKKVQKSIQPIKEKHVEKIKTNSLCNDELLASVGFEITPVDKVVARSLLSINEVLTRLTVLELSGLVSSVPGGYLRLK